MNPARTRGRSRSAVIRLLGLASLFLPALCQAQTTLPVYSVTTIVGLGPTMGGKTGDGAAANAAEIFGPTSVALDSKGNLYIADQFNNVIRSVVGANINEFAGDGVSGYAGDGGTALSAQINVPDSVWVDSKGNVYISDVGNAAVRMVNPSLVISTVAGSQSLGGGFAGDGALAINAELNKPAGIVVDSSGNLYIADAANFRIRKVSNGNISTIAGSGVQGFSGNGSPATQAHLGLPRQIALDSSGALYIADEISNAIRKVAGGVITLVAGSNTGAAGFSGDGGLATNALLDHPTGVAVDSGGNVFICDTYNNVIRIVTPDGNINTIAGSPLKPGYSGDGGPALGAQFNFPSSLNLDSSGKIYLADTNNNVIRLLTPTGTTGGPGIPPAIKTSNGVISASGFGGLTSVAPGTWIEITGTNLAPVTRTWTASDFTGINAPTSLNRTSVTIGGQAAFVDYISPTQINAQVPGTVGLGIQPVTVTTAAGTSAAFNINVTLQQPALFALPNFQIGGKQYVGALFPDFTTYAFPTGAVSGFTSHPAKPGDLIVLYGIGFGAVPGNPPGQIAQASAGLTLPIQPKFYFGGVQAQVSFAGLVGGTVGLYQFNVIVPSIPSNNAVPLTFSVNINGTDVFGTQTLYTAVQN